MSSYHSLDNPIGTSSALKINEFFILFHCMHQKSMHLTLLIALDNLTKGTFHNEEQYSMTWIFLRTTWSFALGN
jgi:hypothetical protein